MSGVWLAAFVVLWAFVFFLAFLVAGALRQIGLIALRLGDDPGALITDTGLDRGVDAPAFEGVDVDSGELRRSLDFERRARVLAFLTPTCLACRELIPHLNEVIETRGREFDFVVICRGDREFCRTLRWRDGIAASVIADETGRIEAAFDVQLTPFVYVLDYEGRVLVRGVANDWRHVESLLNEEGSIQTARWALVEEPAG
jgi:methylamine dehydrogenase accessory protein MauD